MTTADETRARILTEAERLFRHYGYGKTTVADIADACGMSSANVYRFFPSKSAITEAICNQIISQLEVQLRRIVQGPGSASERLTLFFKAIANHTLETLIEEKKVHEMVVVAMEENWGSIQRHLHVCVGMIEEIIRSGIASGEFRKQDPELAARCVHAATASIKHPVIVAQCRDDPTTPEVDDVIAFIVSSLKA